MADTPEDWNRLAERLEELASDMMEQSDCAPNEFDKHIIVLWSRSMMHSAIQMRVFATDEEPAKEGEGR